MEDEVEITEDREIDRLAMELSAAIQNSDEYRYYRDCLEKLKAEPELYCKVNEVRRQNFVLQNGTEEKITFDRFSEVAVQSKKLRENSIVNNFLNSEIGLSRLMQSLHKKVIIGIDFDVDFLN